ncbi:MAG: CHAT domain-containing protein [Symploca sp. SIO1B1]|nr:CHAT domain-containing protein [Symploca sp. SIO1B1]
MKIRKAFIITVMTFLLTILWLPILHVSTVSSPVNNATFRLNTVNLDHNIIAQDSVKDVENSQEVLDTIESKLINAEQLYSQANLEFQAGQYSKSEESLWKVIFELINPFFQEFFEEDECEDAPGGFIFKDICRVINGNLGPAILDEFGKEENFFWQFKLLKSAERYHSTGVNSIRLLQQSIIAQRYRYYGKIDALSVAELGRELEFVRIKPLLNESGLDEDESRGITFTVDIPKGLSRNEIRDSASDQNSTIIYFSVISPEEIFIWVIPPDKYKDITFKKVNLREKFNTSIEALTRNGVRVASSYIDRGNSDKGQVVAWRETLRSLRNNYWGYSDQDFVSEIELENGLKTLYQALIEPVEDALPQEDDSPIVFIPQGSLFSVPFSALQNSSNEYLVDRYIIRVAPNLRSLRNSEHFLKNMPDKDKILFVGNPDMPSVQLIEGAKAQQLPSLPGAGIEAETLAELFGIQALTGAQATESRVVEEINESEIIHLATHGILDDENSLFSIDLGDEIQQAYGLSQAEYLSELAKKLLPGAIALAPSDGKDGLLTSQEILGLKLDEAKLVVLSACNTAKGVPGDSSVLGLPFALGTAGTSRAVVSLWPVPDEPTKQLMIDFYQALKNAEEEDKAIDPAEALSYAMRVMKSTDQYRDPVNWAAFTLLEIKQQ